MKIQTKPFGEIEINDSEIIHFPSGILGFEDLTDYIIRQEEGQSFSWLIPIHNQEVSFILISPFDYFPSYDFELKDNVKEKLKINSLEQLAVFTIVVIPENTQEIRTNLKAPIVINIKEKIAAQVVLEENYNMRQYLFKEAAVTKEGI